MEVKGRGTVIWKLEDDEGVVHKVQIKYNFCVTKLYHCLLSPQNSAQELEKEPGTIYVTQYGSNCVLVMPGFKKTIPKDGKDNVPTMHLAP